MKNLYEKALRAHGEMLKLHINTKTKDNLFHKASEEFYETLFEVAHKIGEKHVDLGGELSSDSLEDMRINASEIITDLKKEIEDYKRNHEVSLGTEDLLGSLANNLEDIEGTSRSFIK